MSRIKYKNVVLVTKLLVFYCPQVRKGIKPNVSFRYVACRPIRLFFKARKKKQYWLNRAVARGEAGAGVGLLQFFAPKK